MPNRSVRTVPNKQSKHHLQAPPFSAKNTYYKYSCDGPKIAIGGGGLVSSAPVEFKSDCFSLSFPVRLPSSVRRTTCHTLWGTRFEPGYLERRLETGAPSCFHDPPACRSRTHVAFSSLSLKPVTVPAVPGARTPSPDCAGEATRSGWGHLPGNGTRQGTARGHRGECGKTWLLAGPRPASPGDASSAAGRAPGGGRGRGWKSAAQRSS